MALHRLMEISIAVPNPSQLDDFYQEIGFIGGKGNWGSAELPGQIKVTEAAYRQLHSISLACEDEADIAAISMRLDAIGVAYTQSNGRLTVIDPINQWQFIIEPAAAFDINQTPRRIINSPGDRQRLGSRAEVIVEATPRPPRRLGHVVVGTPEPFKTVELCQALGYRISDTLAGGMATFMRCSADHHNLLVTPGPVPYLNHYALEHDDFDSVMLAASKFIAQHGPETNLAGPGRHQVGGNVFWYMLDPSGTFFEYFSDMDRIIDDDAWVIKHDWDLADSWSVWGDKKQPEIFFEPKDMANIIEGWNKRL